MRGYKLTEKHPVYYTVSGYFDLWIESHACMETDSNKNVYKRRRKRDLYFIVLYKCGEGQYCRTATS